MALRAVVAARRTFPGADDSIRRLLAALQSDDERLLQGATTVPPPLLCVQDWPCERADFLAWLSLGSELPPAGPLPVADGGPTVGEAEEGFARLCSGADQVLGEPAGVRWFLNWWDDTPRPEARSGAASELLFALGEGPDPAAPVVRP